MAAAETAEATEQEILLLVDAANGFNMLSRLGMLWTVRHRCPKLSRFAFNCYRHEIWLLCQCSSASQTTQCACRNAGRDCTDYLANKNCCNRSSEDDVSETPGAGWANLPPTPETTPRRYDNALHVCRSMQHCFQRRQNLRRTQTKQQPPRMTHRNRGRRKPRPTSPKLSHPSPIPIPTSIGQA